MSFDPVREVRVGLRFDDDTVPVGLLASDGRKIYFEYDPDFINRGLDISPFRLRPEPGLKSFDISHTGGLPGVFNDSLPDGWGRLLLDRLLQSRDILPGALTPLDRLGYVGGAGMGALVYAPELSSPAGRGRIDIDTLAGQVQQVLTGEATEVLETMVELNGSSAGARPKAMIGVSPDRNDIVHGTDLIPDQLADGYVPWLVKFPNSADGRDAGAMEYVYALMAAEAGLNIPEVHLFPSRTASGYFAARRFDRDGGARLHMHTASGLLHSDFRMPSLDYRDLLKLTMGLTKDMREVEKMYRLAVFNVLAHNRDDHAKNFSFLMDGRGDWSLAPAYDLTFSSGPGGEQSMAVMGEGRDPGEDELIDLGLGAGLPQSTIDAAIGKTRIALGRWAPLAEQYGVSPENIRQIGGRISGRD